MTAAVDAGLLAELVWAAALAGVATALCFSLVILGATRATEMRRDGRGLAATAYAALAMLAFLAVAAAVIFGISVITTK